MEARDELPIDDGCLTSHFHSEVRRFGKHVVAAARPWMIITLMQVREEVEATPTVPLVDKVKARERE